MQETPEIRRCSEYKLNRDQGKYQDKQRKTVKVAWQMAVQVSQPFSMCKASRMEGARHEQR